MSDLPGERLERRLLVLAPVGKDATLVASMLRRRGLPLAVAELELDDNTALIDLDDPVVLHDERLRPSRVATRDRFVTQPQALTLYNHHPRVAGLRWWSSWEALWVNFTLFDRAIPKLRLIGVRVLTLDDPTLFHAADFFGLRVA